MQVVRSNRIEILAEALAERLRSPPASGSALEAETVLVHSSGMAAWASQTLARHLGVCANVAFRYPRDFVPDVFVRVFGERAEGVDRWEPDALRWSILAALPRALARPESAPLARYLENDEQGVKRFQLATRLARVLDRYVTYRPDLLRRWELGLSEGGRDEAWQASLFVQLTSQMGVSPLPSLVESFSARLLDPEVEIAGLPPRLSILGVSTLPPFHVRLLEQLSRRVDVCLFLLSPSREYFADVRSAAEQARLAAEQGTAPLHLPSGPPLLASLGRVGREFQELLEEHADYSEPEADLFVDPGRDTLLHALQADLLHLVDRCEGDDTAPRLDLTEGDASVEIHACHGALRQVEVLHDRLLAILDETPDLRPHDILVLTPDVETFAPLVEAVFAREPGDSRRIPFRIADRTVRHQNAVAGTLLTLVSLAGTRATATSVLDLLARPPVHAAFHITVADLDTVTAWVAQSGVRWGEDADDRERHGAPATRQNTWRFGLDRLLLGHALVGDGQRLFGGVLPFDEIEGRGAELAGRLATFCDTLFDVLAALRAEHTPAEWRSVLAAAIDRLVEVPDDDAWQLADLRSVLDRIALQAERAGFDEALSRAQIQQLLEEEAGGAGTPFGFMGGGVTFCAMLPMRSIPFRVVCMLGLEEGSFPRGGRELPFDLSQRTPRRGDRSVRHDDRYLFLEALLSTRERLVLAYTGQDEHTNEPRPPSVVVEDLLDVVDRGYRFPSGGSARDRLVVRHPLQPFSARYFHTRSGHADERMASYAREYLGAARVGNRDRSQAAPLLTSALAIDPAPEGPVRLDDLARFLGHPVRWLLENGLGITLRRADEDPSDADPITLGGLDTARLGSRLLDDRLRGISTVGELERARAAGTVAPGAIGAVALEDIAEEVEPIAERVALACAGDTDPPQPIDLRLQDSHGRTHQLRGRVTGLHAGRLVVYRYTRPRARNLLGDWVRHLALATTLGDAAQSTLIVSRAPSGKRGTWAVGLHVPEDAPEVLADLLDLFARGRRELLPFFAESSLAFARGVRADRGPDAVHDALKAWRSAGPFAPPGEGADAYLLRVHHGIAPFDPARRDARTATRHSDGELDFGPLAVRVYDPLLRHLEELS